MRSTRHTNFNDVKHLLDLLKVSPLTSIREIVQKTSHAVDQGVMREDYSRRNLGC